MSFRLQFRAVSSAFEIPVPAEEKDLSVINLSPSSKLPYKQFSYENYVSDLSKFKNREVILLAAISISS